MSQTETILLIVLGFSLASLIALFMGRMVWTAAVKVGARRMQRQVPSSLVGLQTERDRLRAEYAMLAQRLGGRLEEAKLKLAEQMAEVSRHRNRLHEVERGATERNAELQALKGQIKALEQKLAASRASESELRRALAAREEAAEEEAAEEKPAAEKPAAEEVQKPSAASPAATAEPPPPIVTDPELRLRQRIQKLTRLAKAKMEDQATPAPMPPPVPTPDAAEQSDAEAAIAERLAEAERQTRELESDLRKLEAEWAEPESARTSASRPHGEPGNTEGDDDNVILLPKRARDVKPGATQSS